MKGKNKLSLIQIVYVALVGGVLSGIVKFGWEVMFPPRTP